MNTMFFVLSHPRRDNKVLKILNEHGEASYDGGISHTGYRSISTNLSFEKTSELLSKYIDDGSIVSMTTINI